MLRINDLMIVISNRFINRKVKNFMLINVYKTAEKTTKK